MWWRRQQPALNEAQLQLMQMQLDKLAGQISTGDREGAQARFDFWCSIGGSATPAADLYWEHLAEHGRRLMKQAYG